MLLAVLVGAGACTGATNLDPVDYALTARSVTGGALSSAGWNVILDEARVGFGPLYVCASVSASPEFCETAVAEFAEVASIDLRASAPVDVGRIRGVSDTVHSALYDFGITWRSGSAPTPAAAAPEGHSLILRGTATSGVSSVRFEILIDAVPLQPGSYVVLARIPEKPQSSRIRLELLFDPGLWLGKLDLARLAAQAQPVVLTTADPMGNAIATGLMSDARPTFTWIDVP
ncbi:MAG TPA: hypothetical protein VFH73_10510 [Polyangia bacterium]|nr:hypothetical protein [Polyangia bacterium]